MKEEVKEYLAKIGKKGGDTTKAKYKKKYFSEIGKLGGRPKKKSKPIGEKKGNKV